MKCRRQPPQRGAPNQSGCLSSRFRCIQMWLERRRPGKAGPWLALHGDDEFWPFDQRHRLVHAVGTRAEHSVQREQAERWAIKLDSTSATKNPR